VPTYLMPIDMPPVGGTDIKRNGIEEYHGQVYEMERWISVANDSTETSTGCGAHEALDPRLGRGRVPAGHLQADQPQDRPDQMPRRLEPGCASAALCDLVRSRRSGVERRNGCLSNSRCATARAVRGAR